jgi:hypothetical protein
MLKPCPFCGARDEDGDLKLITLEEGRLVAIKCMKCAARGPVVRDRCNANPEGHWDQRYGEDRRAEKTLADLPCKTDLGGGFSMINLKELREELRARRAAAKMDYGEKQWADE